jgi:hypothetical protein
MNHESHLKKLLSLIIKEPQNNENLSSPRRIFSGGIPNEFLSEEMKKFQQTSLVLRDEEVILLDESLKKLREDLRTEYLKESELKNRLWYLVCEIWTKRKEIKNSKELKLEINSFIEDICKPLEEYEVIFKVHNLRIKKKTRIWDCIIYNYSKSTLIRKGFTHTIKDFSKEIKNFEKQTLISLTVEGNNSSLVTERAREKGNKMIKLLQTYLSEMPFVVNEQLLFSLSKDSAIKKKSESKIIGLNWHRDFSPLEFDYEEQFERFTNKANEHFTLVNSLPNKLKEIIERAIFWIGKSVSEENFDLKVASLCTALETLLTTKQDGRKGERIAYRTALLKRHFEESITHPRHILWLYLIRNDVVHGSKIGIASKSEYHSLLLLSREMLDYYIRLANQNSLKKPTDVIKSLNESIYARELLDWLRLFPDEHSFEITKVLEEDITEKIDITSIPVCIFLENKDTVVLNL